MSVLCPKSSLEKIAKIHRESEGLGQHAAGREHLATVLGDLLADKSLVFFYRIFGLNSDQREKVGVNSYVRITLAKFLASASPLFCPCLVSAFLFEKKMEQAVKRTESREVCLTHEI